MRGCEPWGGKLVCSGQVILLDEVCQQPGGMNIQISISSIGVLMLQLDASIWQESRAHYWKQYLRALGRLYWELGRVVLHRCCSWAWSVLVLELRSLSPTLLRAALLGEQASTARSVTHCMGLLQMDPRGGAGEVSLPLLGRPEQGSSRESSTFGLVGMLRMHVHAPVEGVGTCQVRIQEVETW